MGCTQAISFVNHPQIKQNQLSNLDEDQHLDKRQVPNHKHMLFPISTSQFTQKRIDTPLTPDIQIETKQEPVETKKPKTNSCIPEVPCNQRLNGFKEKLQCIKELKETKNLSESTKLPIISPIPTKYRIQETILRSTSCFTEPNLRSP